MKIATKPNPSAIERFFNDHLQQVQYEVDDFINWPYRPVWELFEIACEDTLDFKYIETPDYITRMIPYEEWAKDIDPVEEDYNNLTKVMEIRFIER